MIADESGQSSGLSAAQEQSSSESTSQAIDLQPPRNVDERPIGRCYNEMTRLLNLVAQAKAIDAALHEALTAFWACRDAAAASAATQQSPTSWASIGPVTAASIFEQRADHLATIERELGAPE